MNWGRMLNRACGPFLLALLLGACGPETRPSAEDDARLNEAAEMLDEAPETLSNIEENQFEGAAANEPAPQ